MYNKDDTSLKEKLIALGLNEYSIQRLINVANAKNISLQKAYRLTEMNVLNVDAIMTVIMLIFSFSVGMNDTKELFALILIFGLLFIAIEVTCRFHKDFWKMIKCYIRLNGI